MTARIEIWGLEGIPEITAGDDLGRIVIRAGAGLQNGDVVVVTSKVVSKAEGRLVAGSRDDHLDAETVRVVAQRGDTKIVETRHGFVLAAAGIDASNVPDGSVALLPVDPDASARNIRDTLLAEIGVDVAVIISDTMGRPWRDGVVDTAIGAAGLDVLWDLRGRRDTTGRLLEATVIAVADELAAAAELVKGKLASTPIAIVRGFPFHRNDPDLGARPLIRPSAEDMFRLGTREAKRQVVRNSAPVPDHGIREVSDPTDHEVREVSDPTDHGPAIRRAVHALGTTDAELSIADDAGAITATGDPLAVGITVGRLLAALAAEDLRGSIAATPAADDEPATATAVVHVVHP